MTGAGRSVIEHVAGTPVARKGRTRRTLEPKPDTDNERQHSGISQQHTTTTRVQFGVQSAGNHACPSDVRALISMCSRQGLIVNMECHEVDVRYMLRVSRDVSIVMV